MGVFKKGIAGALGGVVGIVAMDAFWFALYRRGGGKAGPIEYEFGGESGWDKVSAPGKVGELALTKLLGERPPDSWSIPTRNCVHWLTGIGWGKAYALTGGGRPPLVGGLILGTLAWLTSYAVLPPLGVYQPIWKTDRKELAQDLAAHLSYGVATATVVRWQHENRRG